MSIRISCNQHREGGACLFEYINKAGGRFHFWCCRINCHFKRSVSLQPAPCVLTASTTHQSANTERWEVHLFPNMMVEIKKEGGRNSGDLYGLVGITERDLLQKEEEEDGVTGEATVWR